MRMPNWSYLLKIWLPTFGFVWLSLQYIQNQPLAIGVGIIAGYAFYKVLFKNKKGGK